MTCRTRVPGTLAAVMLVLAGCQPTPTPPPTPVVIIVSARLALPIAVVDRRPARPGKGAEIAAYPGPTPTATVGAGYP